MVSLKTILDAFIHKNFSTSLHDEILFMVPLPNHAWALKFKEGSLSNSDTVIAIIEDTDKGKFQRAILNNYIPGTTHYDSKKIHSYLYKEFSNLLTPYAGPAVEGHYTSLTQVSKEEMIKTLEKAMFKPKSLEKPLENPFEGDEMFNEEKLDETVSNGTVMNSFIDKGFDIYKKSVNLKIVPLWDLGAHFKGYALQNYKTILAYAPKDEPDTVYFNDTKYSPTTTKIQSYLHWRLEKAYSNFQLTTHKGIQNIIGNALPSDIPSEFHKQDPGPKSMYGKSFAKNNPNFIAYPGSSEPEKIEGDPFAGDEMFQEAKNLDVISAFAHRMYNPKTKSANLKMMPNSTGWVLINYDTVLAYAPKDSDSVYVNTQFYSNTTAEIQNKLKSLIPDYQGVDHNAMVAFLGDDAPEAMKKPFVKKEPGKGYSSYMAMKHGPGSIPDEEPPEKPFEGDEMYSEEDIFINNHLVPSGTKFRIN